MDTGNLSSFLVCNVRSFAIQKHMAGQYFTERTKKNLNENVVFPLLLLFALCDLGRWIAKHS
jgi:hypothetical protein